MAAWMIEFKKYLAYNNPAVVENDPSRENVVDQACRHSTGPACADLPPHYPRRAGESGHLLEREPLS